MRRAIIAAAELTAVVRGTGRYDLRGPVGKAIDEAFRLVAAELAIAVWGDMP